MQPRTMVLSTFISSADTGDLRPFPYSGICFGKEQVVPRAWEAIRCTKTKDLDIVWSIVQAGRVETHSLN